MANELPEYWMTKFDVRYRAIGDDVRYTLSGQLWMTSELSVEEAAALIAAGLAWPCDANGNRLAPPVAPEPVEGRSAHAVVETPGAGEAGA